MKLFLHIGTEKTASSFLQTVAAQNRDWLKENGIFFPHAGKSEKMMIAGKISPGNGKNLYEALQRENYDYLSALLRHYRTEAVSLCCEKVLISNENLLEPLSNPEISRNFLEFLQKGGMNLAPFLLVIREPADQALSLYKHRAKSGALESLEQWLATGYHVPFHLHGLFQWVDHSGPGLYLTRYRKDSELLVRAFFQAWLGLKAAPSWKEQIVNPSLTLSELFLIRQVRKTHPSWVSFLYDALLAIPKEKKSDDRYLRADWKAVIQAHLSQFPSLWQDANRRLPPEDQFPLLQVLEKNAGESATLSFDSATLSFTPEQIRVMSEFWLRTRTPLFLIHVFWRHRIRPALALVKWAVFNLWERIKN